MNYNIPFPTIDDVTEAEIERLSCSPDVPGKDKGFNKKMAAVLQGKKRGEKMQKIAADLGKGLAGRGAAVTQFLRDALRLVWQNRIGDAFPDSLFSLPLSVRAHNNLANIGLETFPEIVKWLDDGGRLDRQINMGKKTRDEILTAVALYRARQ